MAGLYWTELIQSTEWEDRNSDRKRFGGAAGGGKQGGVARRCGGAESGGVGCAGGGAGRREKRGGYLPLLGARAFERAYACQTRAQRARAACMTAHRLLPRATQACRASREAARREGEYPEESLSAHRAQSVIAV